MPFTRYFSSFPTLEQITQIEGPFIIDVAPPSPIQGAGTGRALLVGEFPDVTLGVFIDQLTGVISTLPKGARFFSTAEVSDKLGGFDETLGQFGDAEGNGFVELRNKTFAELVVIPINLASSKGVRVWRELPTNKTITDPTPIVPTVPASVSAGREFRTGADRVRVASKATFQGRDAFVTGVNGSTIVAGPAATFVFTSVGATFITSGVLEGDAVVLGKIGDGGPNGTFANTYRVVSVDSETQLTLENQDGSNITTVLFALFVYRIHRDDEADTGGEHQLSEALGYLIPARPLTNGAGISTANGTIPASTLLTPLIAPTAAAADFWDPLSGLQARTDPVTGLIFTSDTQRPNAPNSTNIDNLYKAALAGSIVDDEVYSEVSLVWCARASLAIRAGLKTHVNTAALSALLRTAIIKPQLKSVLSTGSAVATADPGVGANRDRRIIYSWPGLRTDVPEASGLAIPTADGLTTLDGVLDVGAASFLVSVLSNLPPERDPGQVEDPIPSLLAGIRGLQRGLSANLGISDYIALKRAGICAPHIDRTIGPEFYSGVTSQIAPVVDINVSRFADFVELSLASAYKPYKSIPLTNQVKDSILSETVAFLSSLRSEDNPAAQRIDAFSVDGESGNTPNALAQGVYIVVVSVKMTAIGKYIGVQAEVGPTVIITTTL